MWFSGVRGAMAYALAIKSTLIITSNSYGQIILAFTLLFAIFNVILFKKSFIFIILDFCLRRLFISCARKM